MGDKVWYWYFDPSPSGPPPYPTHVATVTAVSFLVKAYKSVSTDGDGFDFEFLDTSRRKAKWKTMLTVTKTIDDGQYQTFSLPSSLSGSVSIRVVDTDGTRGATGLDTIFIDHMVIRQ